MTTAKTATVKNKKHITIETYLPIFNGFYNTIFDTESDEEREVYYLMQEIKEFDQYEMQEISEALANIIDYEKLFNEKAREIYEIFIDLFSDEIKTIGINKIEFQKLSSPKFYNYRNDEIHVKITGKNINGQTIEKLENLINQNHDDPSLDIYYELEGHLNYDRDLLIKELEKN